MSPPVSGSGSGTIAIAIAIAIGQPCVLQARIVTGRRMPSEVKYA